MDRNGAAIGQKEHRRQVRRHQNNPRTMLGLKGNSGNGKLLNCIIIFSVLLRPMLLVAFPSLAFKNAGLECVLCRRLHLLNTFINIDCECHHCNYSRRDPRAKRVFWHAVGGAWQCCKVEVGVGACWYHRSQRAHQLVGVAHGDRVPGVNVSLLTAPQSSFPR